MAEPSEQKQRAIGIHSIQADEFAESYASMREDEYQSCFVYSRKRLDRLLQHALPKRGDGLRVLDVGCGTGHLMARLRSSGFEVSGVDGSEEMLSHARANNPGLPVERSDVESLPFESASFDFVTCIEVLRYLPDPAPALKEMVRVLKPGGTALATAAPLFNSNGYWVINRISSAWRIGSLVPLKQYFLTSHRLRRECLKAGFAAAKIQGVYIGPINWVEHAAPKMLPWLLRKWEGIDGRIADLGPVRELSNMFLVRASLPAGARPLAWP